MSQTDSGIGNVTKNTGLVEMAMAYSRSRVLCAAARLGVADALAGEVRSVAFLAEKCQADPTALYRLLRALRMQTFLYRLFYLANANYMGKPTVSVPQLS